VDSHFGSAYYIGELLPWAVLAMALLVGAVVGMVRLAGRVERRAPIWLQALVMVVVSVVLWEHLFLLVYELGPISGCPDGGMFSGLFALKFAHSWYVTDYVGMPLPARLFFHIAGASGFVLAGAASGRVHWTGAVWGALFAAPYALWRSAPMWYTVVGYDSDVKLTAGALLDCVGPLALYVSALVAGGAMVSAAWRRWSPSNPALQPTPPSRRG